MLSDKGHMKLTSCSRDSLPWKCFTLYLFVFTLVHEYYSPLLLSTQGGSSPVSAVTAHAWGKLWISTGRWKHRQYDLAPALLLSGEQLVPRCVAS